MHLEQLPVQEQTTLEPIVLKIEITIQPVPVVARLDHQQDQQQGRLQPHVI